MPDDVRDLGARLPQSLRLGTSSWSFPGWAGLVWSRAAESGELARDGLKAYAAHPLFRTVGLDRTYYRPMSAAALSDLRANVAPGFRFLVKAHQACLRPTISEHSTFGASESRVGDPNPVFLDPAYAIDQVIEPCVRGLGAGTDGALGPILFQFSPMSLRTLGGVDSLLDRLDAFLERLGPRGNGRDGRPLLAVEVRNAELLTPRYESILRRHGVCHAFSVHPSLPPPDAQAALLAGSADRTALRALLVQQPALVARWLLIEGQEYESAKHRYEPFDRIVDEDNRSRDLLAAMCARAVGAARDAYVIINNKAEGSAPRSVERLARAILERPPNPNPPIPPAPTTHPA